MTTKYDIKEKVYAFIKGKVIKGEIMTIHIGGPNDTFYELIEWDGDLIPEKNIYKTLEELREKNYKKKYYIEFYNVDNENEYIMQSKWFNTKEQALNFREYIDFVDDSIGMSLMSAYFDKDGEIVGDIEQEETLPR